MMLYIAIGIIAIGTVYILVKAPVQLRTTAMLLIVVATAIGAGVGYLAATDNYTSFYYPIAGAFGGWIVGAAIYDSKRKKALRAQKTDESNGTGK